MHANATASDSFEIALRGTPPRFVAAARAVWAATPPVVRADLLRRWQDPFRRPLVLIVDDPIVDGCPVAGYYQQTCGALVFDGGAVERLSPDGLAALICHELIHCWRFSDAGRDATASDEQEAEFRAAAWGFPWRAEYDAALREAAAPDDPRQPPPPRPLPPVGPLTRRRRQAGPPPPIGGGGRDDARPAV